MISFPNAKINIGLRVLHKRRDGFHELESIFYPVGVKDVLEIIESKELKFSSSGIAIPGNESDNLCLKAYELIRRDFDLPPVHIQLHKHIPIGAGLGGGSADASFLIRLVNHKFKLEMDSVKMESIASELGSDCAFFIRNVPSYARGRGEVLDPIELDLGNYNLVLVMPQVHVSTADAFRGIIPGEPSHNLLDLIRKPVEDWKDLILNDFEGSVLKKYPQIQTIKSALYDAGAVYASMSGSGAAVYGIFNDDVCLPDLEDSNRIFYRLGNVNTEMGTITA